MHLASSHRVGDQVSDHEYRHRQHLYQHREPLEKMSDFLHRDIKFFLGIEEKQDIRFALRADSNLSKKDQDEILGFIDFVKNKKNG